MYTVRIGCQRDRQEMSQRNGCDRSVTICSQFWLGPVTSEEFEEELAHDHFCAL